MVHRKIRLSLVHAFYALFFLFLLNRLFFFSPGITEKTFSCIVYPFVRIQSLLIYPFQNISLHSQSLYTLQQKIEQLSSVNEDLQAELIKQQSLQTFHEESKEVVEYARQYKTDSKQLAHVLLKTSNDKEDTILIDIGTTKNAQKDDVVVYKNMLVGRIVETYPWYSKVALVTDKRCRVSAQCKKDVTGICCGKNNGQLELNFVPHFKDVKINDLIISTGQGLVYPKGFALGVVSDIQSDNVSHYIQVKSMISLNDLEYVYLFHK